MARVDKFELYNYPEWKPIKVFQITYEKNNNVPKERLKELIVFVGKQPGTVRDILSNISKQDLEAQRWKPKLNQKQEDTLVRAFGKSWKSVLGLSRIAEFGATAGRVRSQGTERSGSVVQRGGAEETLEETELEALITEAEDDELEEKEIEIQLAESPAEILEEKAIAVTTAEPETEEELLKLIEEAEKEEAEAVAKKIREPEAADVAVKIEILEARGAFVSFVFDYINQDDSIETIKKKLYAYTRIPMVAQHLFYLRESPIFKGDLEAVNVEYAIYNIKERMKEYPVSILNLFSVTEQHRSILGIPIDENFIIGMDIDRSLFIKDNNIKLLDEYPNFDDELYLVDFVDLVDNLVNNVKLNDVIISNPNTLRDFYSGFVVKYWPGIRNSPNSLIALINKKYEPTTGVGTIIRDQESVQNQIGAVTSINKEEVVKYFKLDAHDKRTKILSVTVRIGFPEEIGVTALMKRQKLFSFRNLFDFFEVNEITPYIKYKNREANKINHKVFKPFYNNNINLVKRSWSLTEPIGISIKMRMTEDPSKTTYSSFATVNIFEDGRIELKATWAEIENANLRNVMEVLDVLRGIINQINDLGPNVFEKTQKRIVLPTSHNTQIASINVSKEFTTTMSEQDYKDIALVTKIFDAYTVLDTDRKIDLEKNAFSIYWRYLRTSAISRKGPKVRIRGRNEVLINLSRDVEQIGKTVRGTVVEMIGGEIPKIIISGARGIREVNRIYNFYSRFLYIFKNIDKVLKTTPFAFARNLYRTYMKQAKKTKAGLRIVKGRPVKKVRKLQQLDPKLFDFKAKGNKFQFYSRVCQSKQQPLAFTDSELVVYSKTHKPEEILKYSNKTRKGQSVNYVCEDPVYRFPGFIPKDKHPDGFCMPCCFKKSSLHNPRSTNYKVYQQCMREELGQTISPDEDPAKEATNRRYILGWKSEEIEEGRFSFLPTDLNEFLNTPKKCIIKNNMLQKNSDCYLIAGMYQDNQSFPRVVANALIGRATTEERAKILSFWDDTIDFLRKHPSIFNVLERGEVRRHFGNIERYLEYLTGEETIDDTWTHDLLSNYNPLGDPVNIVVFQESAPGRAIKITCDQDTFSFLENLNKPDRASIVVVKSRQSEQRIFYYGIYLVQTDASAIPKLSIQKSFVRGDPLLDKITTLFRDLCGVTDDLSKKFTDFLTKFGAQYMIDAKTIQDLLIDNNNNKYKITGQVLTLDSQRPRYIIINKKFSFPVNNASLQLVQVPIVNEPIEGRPDEVLDFMKYISKKLDIKLTVKKKVLDKRGRYIIGFFLNTHYFVPLARTEVNKVKLPNDISTYTLRVNPSEVNKFSLTGKKIPDERVKESKKINFEREVFQTLLLEISRKLYNERNKRVRKKIMDILDKLPLRNSNDYRLIKNRLLEIKEVTPSDFQKLKEIIKEMFRNKHQLNLPKKELASANDKLLQEESFDFDRVSARQIENIIATQPTMKALKEVRHILEKIAEDIIIVVPDHDNKHIEKVNKDANIIETCTDASKNKCVAPQCLWSKNGCKVIVPKSLYKGYLKQVTEEITKNELRRFDILGNNIDLVLDKTKFLKRPTEMIFETVPRIIVTHAK